MERATATVIAIIRTVNVIAILDIMEQNVHTSIVLRIALNMELAMWSVFILFLFLFLFLFLILFFVFFCY